MIRFSPTVLYGIIAMLIICLLLGAVTLPNASRWFQGAHAAIQQDLIVLLENATSLKYDAAYGHHEWQYSQNLVAVDNTPMPSETGLQGILYDRGLSCSQIVNNTIPSLLQESTWKINLARIALIQLGGCRLLEKLEFAQNDGASAVIFYDNASFVTPISDETPEGMRIDPNKVFIPAYLVDDKTGKELYERLVNLTQWETWTNENKNNTMKNERHEFKNGDTGDTTLGTSHLVTRVTMYPDQKPFLEPWQFAMIVIGVVIITSIVIVIAVQCHLCHMGRKRRRDQRPRQRQRQRRRQRQQHMDGEYQPSYLDGVNDDEEDDDDNDNMAQESFWLQLISAARTEDDYHYQRNEHHHHHSHQEKKKRYRLHPSVLDSIPTREWNATKTDADQCVICLESFSPGDILRILPCEHEYHCDCIDIWLTKKNACCPLCLQLAVTLPSIPKPAYIRDHYQHLYHHQEPSETNHSPDQYDEGITNLEPDDDTSAQQQHSTSTDSSLWNTWFASHTTSTSSLSSLSTTSNA